MSQYDTCYDGVTFSEETMPMVRVIKAVEVTLDQEGIGKGSQLKNLDDVKAALARQVKAVGGNALMDFTYGQKTVGFWQSLFSIDNIAWWGKGIAVKR